MSMKIILMADNLHDFLEERREFLEQVGYTVVTAYDPVHAENILAKGGIDLAILDLRLVNDFDESDTSGLELAQKFGQKVPIIILTGYPTWEAVKVALGKDLNGLSPAVDFLSKQEGPQVMVRTVNMTIENPVLKKNMLQEFKTRSTQALHEALVEKRISETTDMFQKSLARTEQDLLQHRQEISQQSEKYQKTAILMGFIGMGVIVLGVILVYFNVVPLAVLSGVTSIIFEAITVLFIKRAIETSKQVDKNYEGLQEIYKANLLISICDTLITESKREDAKMMIIEKLLGGGFDKPIV